MSIQLPFYISQGDTTNESKIEKNFETIAANVTDYSTDISTLQTDVSTLQSDVSALQAGLSYTQKNLTSVFNTSTSSTFQDTGLDVTLTTAGTWLIIGDLRIGNSASGRYATARLYNETTSSEYANSYRIGGYLAGTTYSDAQFPTNLTQIIVTTTTNNVIRVDLKPAGAYVASLYSDSNGSSALTAIKLA